MTHRRNTRNQGFTLVETALAMMVGAMGLLVVMGLFIGGLDAQMVTANETQGALFAEQVMTSVRAALHEDWKNPTINIGPAVKDEWGRATPVRPTSSPRPVTYSSGEGNDIEEFSLQYTLEVGTDSKRDTIKLVKLSVWRGVGDTDPEDAVVYYTEVFNAKRVQ